MTDLALAYSNTTLFGLPGELSLTSMPGLIIRMIESLDVHDGHRVLGPIRRTDESACRRAGATADRGAAARASP